ncbi:tachylectin-2-like [Dendropsophus ebraccatus]|uniref:tachylectin-2-like n=1 Tax=Dendropsophus ebraccatus TaxID=150705 RepID=UPI003831AE21
MMMRGGRMDTKNMGGIRITDRYSAFNGLVGPVPDPSKLDKDTLLLAFTQDYTVQIGLPPRHHQDSYSQRAITLGKIENVNAIACSPAGELFCIRSGDLYRGPMPSKKVLDWFTVARRVGRFDWTKVKLIFFSPNGDFYCTTHSGDFYKGPPPENENVPWFYDRATKIGRGNWQFLALLFHPNGNLYGVINNKLYFGPPPTDEYCPWNSQEIEWGWERYTHFMGITNDDVLWCVDRHNGNLYKGFVPKPGQLFHYRIDAECVGWGYNNYRFLSFTKDRTITNIISFDFLVDEGEKLSETPEVLEEKLYDNRGSSTIMRHTYTINKTVRASSTFSHEHGFTFEAGLETSFKCGIPFVSEASTTIRLNMSTTHNWNLTKTNETETSFESSTNVELEPGKAIKVVSSVMKSEINIPYKAIARTMFGAEVEVRGKWFGVSHYNLTVKQVDFNK